MVPGQVVTPGGGSSSSSSTALTSVPQPAVPQPPLDNLVTQAIAKKLGIGNSALRVSAPGAHRAHPAWMLDNCATTWFTPGGKDQASPIRPHTNGVTLMSAVGPSAVEFQTTVDAPELGIGEQDALVANEHLAPLGRIIMEHNFGLDWRQDTGFVITYPNGERVPTWLDEQFIPYLGDPKGVETALSGVRAEVMRMLRELGDAERPVPGEEAPPVKIEEEVGRVVSEASTIVATVQEEVALAAEGIADVICEVCSMAEVALPARRRNNPLAVRDDREEVKLPVDHMYLHLPKLSPCWACENAKLGEAVPTACRLLMAKTRRGRLPR